MTEVFTESFSFFRPFWHPISLDRYFSEASNVSIFPRRQRFKKGKKSNVQNGIGENKRGDDWLRVVPLLPAAPLPTLKSLICHLWLKCRDVSKISAHGITKEDSRSSDIVILKVPPDSLLSERFMTDIASSSNSQFINDIFNDNNVILFSLFYSIGGYSPNNL